MTLAGETLSDRLAVNSTKTGDNSYVVKLEAQLPTGWQAGLGMDMVVAGAAKANNAAAVARDIDRWSTPDRSTAVAWATLAMPAPGWMLGGQAKLRAQIDPQGDSATLSGNLTRTRPLGDELSASLIDSVTVTERGIGSSSIEQNWEANKSLRLEFKPTGTALIARGQIAGPDEFNSYLTAEQPLGGGLGMTTSLAEIETGEPVLNIGARFNRTW